MLFLYKKNTAVTDSDERIELNKAGSHVIFSQNLLSDYT